MFYSRQDMFGEVKEEEKAEKVSKDEEIIQEVAKSIDLIEIMQANPMIRSRREPIGQEKMENHRHVITVDQSTIISTSAQTMMKM